MFSFTIKHEAMSRVEEQQKEFFRVWYEMPRKNRISIKTNVSKTISLFNKVANITSKR